MRLKVHAWLPGGAGTLSEVHFALKVAPAQRYTAEVRVALQLPSNFYVVVSVSIAFLGAFRRSPVAYRLQPSQLCLLITSNCFGNTSSQSAGSPAAFRLALNLYYQISPVASRYLLPGKGPGWIARQQIGSSADQQANHDRDQHTLLLDFPNSIPNTAYQQANRDRDPV